MKFDLDNVAKAAAFGVAATAMLSSADAALVINEIYTYGGGVGAVFNADYVELTNNGLTAVSYTAGITLQYGSSLGYFATNTFSVFTTGSLSLLPGATYLIGGSTTSGTVGVALPVTPDLATSLNLAQTSGKLRILDGTTVLDLLGYGGAAATPTSVPTTPGFTGAGFEGTGPAGAPTALLSLNRVAGLDTNSNPTDFITAAPTPTTSSTPEPTALGLAAAAGSLLIGRRKR